MTRLDEFTKDEWFDIARQFKPDLSEAEYNHMWDDFQAMKAEHLKRKTLN